MRSATVLAFWLLALALAPGLRAQTPAADSLRAEVRAHARPDTARANRLNALALALRNNAPEESAALFRTALGLSQRLGYVAGAAEAQLGLGFYHRHRGEYGVARTYSEQARQGFEQVGSRRGQTRSLYNLACVFLDQGMYAKSLQANLLGLALAEAQHDRRWQAFLNTQLGITSTYLSEYDRARSYLNEGLRWAQISGDQPSIGYAYSGLGMLHKMQGQWAAAQRNFEQDNANYRLMKDQGGMLYEDINIGDMLERQGKYPQAFAYGFRSLARASRLQKLNEVTRVQLLLARTFLHTHQPDSALRYGQLCLRASQLHGTKNISRDASQVLAQASVQRGRYADAYRYEQLFGVFKDSLNSSDLQRRAAVLEYRAELAKKQVQIGLLTKNAQLIRKQNRQQGWFLAGALLGLGLVGGLSVVLWRNNRDKQRAYAQLEQQQAELRAAQTQLVQAEKWAFVGEVSAGIAHELQNPLNFMKNFAEVSTALLDDEDDPAADRPAPAELEQAILTGLRKNLQQISQHGQRASAIINDMLAHARSGHGQAAPTDLNALVQEYLTLAYRGLQAQDAAFRATLRTEFDPALPPVAVVPPDLGRVLLNLCGNGLYAVRARQQTGEKDFQPTLTVRTQQHDGHVEIRVRDNGMGMSAAVLAQVFQPFFTTKPAGEGTGLGLSLSHDIVTKGHGGTLTVESREGQGTEFLVRLPR